MRNIFESLFFIIAWIGVIFGYTIEEHTNCNNVFASAEAPQQSNEFVKFLGLFDTTQECINACLNGSNRYKFSGYN